MPLLCLGHVNGKIKLFFTRKSDLPPGLLPSMFFFYLSVFLVVAAVFFQPPGECDAVEILGMFLSAVGYCCLNWFFLGLRGRVASRLRSSSGSRDLAKEGSLWTQLQSNS